MSKINLNKLFFKTLFLLSVLTIYSISIANAQKNDPNIKPYGSIINASSANNSAESSSKNAAAKVKLDFFGNKLTDFAILTYPTSGGQARTRILRNDNPTSGAPGAATILDIPFGQTSTDSIIPAPGDYTGDGITDITVYRNANGSPANTYITLPLNTYPQPAGNPIYRQWGISTTDYIGAEGDYDGDGKIDPTVVRNIDNAYVWYVLRSSDNTFMAFNYGRMDLGDYLLSGADYNGDGKDDPTVARVGSDGSITYIVGTTSSTVLSYTRWGNFNTDFIVPGGDYDGDGKADFMVWRGFVSSVNPNNAGDGTWYLRTATGNMSYLKFGLPGTDASGMRDTPLRGGDYDGDGKDDIAVYRPSNGSFYVNRSSNGGLIVQNWTVPGNTNVPVAKFGVQ